MKLKRSAMTILTALLAIMIVVSGCTNGGTTQETTTANQPGTTTKATTTGSTAEVKEDAVTIIWYSGGNDQTNPQPAHDALNELLLERHNILLDFRTYPFGVYDEKMNMIISSGEAYDLCFTSQAWVNKYPIQVAKGAFLALDDYLPNYPALQEALPEFLFEQARMNGKIYAVPNYQITYAQWGFLFRKDLIDESEFDYESVESFWEAEPFWQFVKENHPDLYPSNTKFESFANVLNTYIPVDANCFYHRDDPERKVSVYMDKQESLDAEFGPYYSGLQNRIMWEKGYFREDIATVQDETADDAAGKFASIAGVVKPGGEAERKKKSANYDWVQIGVQRPFTTSVASRSAMTAVNALSEHPEEALRMLEIMNTDPEAFNMLNFGVEGVNYTLNDQGKVSLIDESGYFYNAAWAIGNQFNALLMDNQEDGIWEATDKLNREAEISPINGFSFDNSAIITEIANVEAVRKEFENWEYQDNYESRYDEYYAKMKQAGIDTIVAEVQKQLDDWWAANK
ncbi:MAG: ABC transporter substrate-binding protein [Ruminococcaceae bacterium]|nr:ABC transporter substrate-binding protein [Oscillospiraceae bacterium]